MALAPAHAEPDLVDEAPLVTVAPGPAPGTHRVAAGETLYRIARIHGTSAQALAELNGIPVSAPLAVGQLLVVPAPPEPDLPPGTPAASPAPPPASSEQSHPLPPALAAAFDAAGPSRSSPGSASAGLGLVSRPGGAAEAPPAGDEPVSERAAAAGRRDPRGPGRLESSVLGALPATAQVGKAPASVRRAPGQLQWPLRGVLYARFGRKGKSPHDGIDLAAPVGTPVRTAAEGSVLFAGPQQGYGLLVIIEHHQGLVTVYAHNRDLRVRTGQQVRDGQVIATVGESGKTSGPHLHFEVRQDGAPVDPLDFLGPPPAS